MQLEKEKDVVEQQFNQLYHDKYYPLKESHKAAVVTSQQLQEQQHQSQERVEKLRTQLATADLKLRKSGLEAQALAQQLQQSQSNLEASLCVCVYALKMLCIGACSNESICSKAECAAADTEFIEFSCFSFTSYCT